MKKIHTLHKYRKKIFVISRKNVLDYSLRRSYVLNISFRHQVFMHLNPYPHSKAGSGSKAKLNVTKDLGLLHSIVRK